MIFVITLYQGLYFTGSNSILEKTNDYCVGTPLRKHLTDIHEWQKLGEANIFPPESRLELIQRRNFRNGTESITTQ